MRIVIRKPLYRTEEGIVVGIRASKVTDAIARGEPLIVSCEGNMAVFSPQWVAGNAPVIKKAFLYPDNPMRLYKLFIKSKKENQIEKLAKLGIFG